MATLALSGHTLVSAQAPAAQSSTRTERTVWYFYRVKWGFQDEFVRLFRKNHYPVLKEEMKSGRIKDVRTFVPTYHGDGRADWTFAVVIVYRDTAAMTGPSNDAEIVKRLYPDAAAFAREEQRRFEILDAHWDVPLNEMDMDGQGTDKGYKEAEATVLGDLRGSRLQREELHALLQSLLRHPNVRRHLRNARVVIRHAD